MKRKFEILPHTADLRLRATAGNMSELFSAALDGMNKIIKVNPPNADANWDMSETVKISSIDESMLLVDFLSEILTLSHKNKAIYRIKTIKKLSETGITAALEGIKLNGFDEDIKAVTYTEAKIKKNKENDFEVIIVFDI
jgi:SHS2 domain-containing protein